MAWKKFIARFRRPTLRRPEVKPYTKNAPGDFYVAENCCLWCGVPEVEAPEHFDMDDTQCYIRRQPTNPVEVSRVVSAMSAQDLDCIRYRGRDQRIIAAIRAETMGDVIDDHQPEP